MKNINKYQFRYQILSLLDKDSYTTMDVAWELNLSARHIRRLLAKFRKNKKKLSTIMPKLRSSSEDRITQDIIDEVIRLKKKS